jgi:general secretion pathway protein I
LSRAMLFDRARRRRYASEGFTLIEALVALAVAAAALTTIGALMAVNIRGSGKIVQHLGLIATLRAVEAGLPDRTDLVAGDLSGEMHGQAWSVGVTPFPGSFVNPRAAQSWAPEVIVITMQSPSGGLLQLKTVRLAKISGER